MSEIQKNVKNKYIVFLGSVVLVLVLGFTFFFVKDYIFKSTQENKTELTSVVHEEDIYTNKVQKIFNSRCVACHGCYESPCQLNLQSYEGLARGVHADYVFDRDRSEEAVPTRLFEDANTLSEWRRLGFKDVIGKDEPQLSVLSNAVQLTLQGRPEPKNKYPEGRQCINQETPVLIQRMKHTRLGMPYNLPGLDETQITTITDWVNKGAIPPVPVDVVERDPKYKGIISKWENFLNHPDYKHKLTSRYIFEHLYLAHLYIKENPRQFYRLIRSETLCDKPVMIPTRTANATPFIKPSMTSFYYCIVKFPATIVNKSHLPYEISSAKVDWMHNLFIMPAWQIDSGELPPYQTDLPIKKPLMHTYENSNLNSKDNPNVLFEDEIKTNKTASNPFFIFKNIPQESRYRFLLEDSYFHIMTFMKGPSCNGTMAVNAIQDRFFVFFMTPEMDRKINTQEVLEFHQFPGRYGREVEDKKISAYIKQVRHRNKSRKLINKNLAISAPNGLPMETIWDGDREQRNGILTTNNRNAVLTILRHNDSASVERGAVGDITKTAFLMDYSTLERMVYDLVVNFDVFGNFGHMMLTRTYMGLIRTDAENTYLNFFPPDTRLALKKAWYNDHESLVKWSKLKKQNLLDKLALKILDLVSWTKLQQGELYNENRVAQIPSAINFQTKEPQDMHLEMIQKILFDHLGSDIIGADDRLNWNKLKSVENSDQIEAKLSELTGKAQNKKQPFNFFFPEISYIVLGTKNKHDSRTYQKFYSLIHNREFNSISLVIGEEYHHRPEDDTLSLFPKVVGYYPNQFFYVEDNQRSVDEFVNRALAVTDIETYAVFLEKYGVKRMDSEIWNIYDFIVDKYHKEDVVGAGYLDLSRYNY